MCVCESVWVCERGCVCDCYVEILGESGFYVNLVGRKRVMREREGNVCLSLLFLSPHLSSSPLIKSRLADLVSLSIIHQLVSMAAGTAGVLAKGHPEGLNPNQPIRARHPF